MLWYFLDPSSELCKLDEDFDRISVTEVPVCCPKNAKIKIYRNIILPVGFYGCEIWSPVVKEEHRLRVLRNRVLMMLFGPKGDEVTEEWREDCITRSFMISVLLNK